MSKLIGTPHFKIYPYLFPIFDNTGTICIQTVYFSGVFLIYDGSKADDTVVYISVPDINEADL